MGTVVEPRVPGVLQQEDGLHPRPAPLRNRPGAPLQEVEERLTSKRRGRLRAPSLIYTRRRRAMAEPATELTLDSAVAAGRGRARGCDRRAQPVVPRLAPAAAQLGRARLARRLHPDRRRLCARAGLRAARRAHRPEHRARGRDGARERQAEGGRSAAARTTTRRRTPSSWRRRRTSARPGGTRDGRFVLGTDNLGRDVAVRLLYGGRNSLKVGIGSALICTLVAVLLALIAGYYGGWVDWVVSRFFDLIWAFPVLPARDRARRPRCRSTASTTSASRSSRAASGSRPS